MQTNSRDNSVQIHDDVNRVLFMNDRAFLFNSNSMKDSEAFKYAICETDPGDNYTVSFERI